MNLPCGVLAAIFQPFAPERSKRKLVSGRHVIEQVGQRQSCCFCCLVIAEMPGSSPVNEVVLELGELRWTGRWSMASAIAVGPRGRLAEDGPLPLEYRLRETATAEYAERTRLNVRDSDANLILNEGPLEEGTRLTFEVAQPLQRPVLLVQLDDPTVDAPRAIPDWLQQGDFTSVNIAGPRESSRPGIYQRVYQLLEACAALALATR